MEALADTSDAADIMVGSARRLSAPWSPASTAAATSQCPVCSSDEWNYAMNAHGLTFFACENCRLLRLHPLPSAKTLAAIRNTTSAGTVETTNEEFERARAYWEHLQILLGEKALESRILLFSSEEELLLRTGREMGFLHIERFVEDAPPAAATGGKFDCCLAVFAVERLADPGDGLCQIQGLLKPDGKLVMVAPLINSWPAKICGSAWTQLRPENRFYFSTENLETVLLRSGFHHVQVQPDRRHYTLHQLGRRARSYPATRLTRLVRGLCGLVPSAWRDRFRLPLPTSAFIVTATKRNQNEARPKLSIVMPVYNERTTFEECFRAVVAKEIEGVDKEIIVVESNSKDGTRELVQKLCIGEGVRLILQDHASGKGNAVRAGLRAVTGDVVLIQDADLEYDVNDYDALLKPILQRRTALVLGSRHIGNWKLRKFNDQPFVAAFFNIGHLFFCAALNLLYRQSMKDPFTMYKVFRTDCLHGLEFECDRFDFDFEILIKLIRKGYSPLELPVNYNARSLNEGKKVTAVRDPLTWLRALVKYRFCRIAPSIMR